MIIEKHKHVRGIMRLLVLFVIVLGGCKSLSWRNTTPKLSFTSPTTGNKVEASGNAAEPAKVETKKATTEIPLPPNSQVSFVENVSEGQRKTVVTVPSATVLKLSESSESVTQAKSFGPPSAVELAKADGVKWFYIAGSLFAVATIAFVYLAHYKAAGISAIAAFAVPMLGNLATDKTALLVCVGLGTVALTLFVAWYLVKNHPELKAEAVSELAVVKARLLAFETAAKAKLESLNNHNSVPVTVGPGQVLANPPSTP